MSLLQLKRIVPWTHSVSTKAPPEQETSIKLDDSCIINLELGTEINLDPNIDNERSQPRSKLARPSQCIQASFPSILFVTLVLISLVLGQQYVKDMLIYIDTLDLWESTVLFAVMYTIVAFPIMWGYVLLNIACGYTYGFLQGTLMTSGCVTYAILCAHFIIRRFFKGYVERTYVINEQTKALMNVVSGPSGYKIVFLTRFTPIPFGLQNAIFAVSDIRTIPYVLSSSAGLLLTQCVYSYMGSTLRSIAEVFSDENSIAAWILLATQVFITIGLTAFIIRLAKRELDKNVKSDSTTSVNDEASAVSTSCSAAISLHATESIGIQTMTSKEVTYELLHQEDMTSSAPMPSANKMKGHGRNMSVNIPPIVIPSLRST